MIGLDGIVRQWQRGKNLQMSVAMVVVGILTNGARWKRLKVNWKSMRRGGGSSFCISSKCNQGQHLTAVIAAVVIEGIVVIVAVVRLEG